MIRQFEKIITSKLFVIILIIIVQDVKAQTGNNPSPVNYNIDVYPKTPEAAALSKFVDIPAGSYTGVADFSIPLYTIEFDGGSIPIELRYTTTGVKVGEIATRVGLGWVLNTGPSLSQQVIGVHDKTFPRPVIPTNPFNIDYGSYSDSYVLALRAAGIQNNGVSPVDIKPDIFTYSLLNTSGKYILDWSGQYGIPMPYNQIKITPSSYYTIMDITDEEGVQYKFENYPGSISKNTCAEENLNGLTYADPNFKITKIKSIKNQEINYIYGRNINNAKYINSVTTQGRISIEGFLVPGQPQSPPAPQCINYTNLVDQALTEISFKGGKVLFSYSENERLDVNGEIYLTNVVVMNDKDEIIKSFSLTYNYFESPQSIPVYSSYSFLNDYTGGMNKRLKLVSVKDDLTNGIYHLDYYENYQDKVLPIRISNDQDHWGVYNGKENGEQSLPYTKHNVGGIVKLFGSANKEPDINYGRLGNLKKITYPTGGYTEIFYEADDYIKALYAPPVYDYQHSGWDQYADEYSSYVFTIPENSYQKQLRFFGDNQGSTTSDQYCTWRLLNSLSQIVGSGQGTGTFDRSDAAGIYTLEVIPGQSSNGSCYAEYGWLNEIIVNNSDTRQSGTIRVSKIESFDNNNGKIIRKYTYKDPGNKKDGEYIKTSGKNLGNEIFVAVSTQEYPLDNSGHYAIETLLSNNPGWQTATVRGKPIGYDYVQEHYISEDNPSKSYRKEYKFKNDIDDVWTQHNPYSPINYTWPIEGLDRGLLLEEKLFDSSGQLVKETFKEYQNQTHFNTITTSYIGGEFLGEGLEIVPIRHTGSSTLGYEFAYSTFPIKNYWITDTLTTTIEYKTPTDFLTTIQRTRYSIPDYKHTYPVSTSLKGSLGETSLTEYYYPQDLTSYYEQDLMMQKLVQRNQLSSAVIVKNFMDGAPISEQRTHYVHFFENDPSGGFILPKHIFLKKGEIGVNSSSEDRKITYDSYDSDGNLTQYTLENGNVVSIIWGYQGKYPIAKVEGVPYSQIETLANILITDSNSTYGLEPSYFDNLRGTTGAIVTCYIYNPLVGVTTVIAPNGQESHYVYDVAGRLEKVLDQYGHVLKKMEYHYKD